MATRKGLLRCIDSCNGEIRLQSVRYTGASGDGFYCIVARYDQPDIVWERWEDLVGGDNDYFNALKFFGDNGDLVTLVNGSDPVRTMEKALDMAAEKLNGWED